MPYDNSKINNWFNWIPSIPWDKSIVFDWMKKLNFMPSIISLMDCLALTKELFMKS